MMLRISLQHLCARLSHQCTVGGTLNSTVQSVIGAKKWCFVPGTHPSRSAGHSHWKNIKHTKEAKDADKQKAALNVVRRIRNAVREGGGTDPKFNSLLARVLEDGKMKDIPNSTMYDALRRLEKAGDFKGSQAYVEAKVFGNCMLIVELFTERTKHIRTQVQHVCKRYGGTICEAGSVVHMFNFKGVVYLPVGPKEVSESKSQSSRSSPSSILPNIVTSIDSALELAIDVGAEDVVEGYDGDDQPAYQFICDTKELHAVKKALIAKGLQPGVAQLEYIPHTFSQLDESLASQASDIMDELENIDDVVRIYHNIEISSSQQQSSV